ncbi:hypothetical protein DENSPDRAFT_331899 [Dentipellis sp. KUC8613]|nr:hypothetical protein DENSPDRAFT_331899 [Dentipellis sp. KUC8613]
MGVFVVSPVDGCCTCLARVRRSGVASTENSIPIRNCGRPARWAGRKVVNFIYALSKIFSRKFPRFTTRNTEFDYSPGPTCQAIDSPASPCHVKNTTASEDSGLQGFGRLRRWSLRLEHRRFISVVPDGIARGVFARLELLSPLWRLRGIFD